MTDESQSLANFRISISLEEDTLNRLTNEGYSLYAFKAVETARPGQPTVWSTTRRFAPTVSLNWTQEYQAYVSNTEISDNVFIEAVGTTDIDIGQTWQVSNVGTGPVVRDGDERAVSLLNQSSRRWSSSGISQKENGELKTLCAFPLNGFGLNEMIPVEKVLLMFATDQANTGTVIFKAFTPALLVDLTGATNRSVAFDLDEAWDWGGFDWGRQFPANSDLAPILITPP